MEYRIISADDHIDCSRRDNARRWPGWSRRRGRRVAATTEALLDTGHFSALSWPDNGEVRVGQFRQILPGLFRQSVCSRLAGYEDTNDAERLAEDPAFQMARRVTLDVDSSESPVHGGQEQSAYNGHFENPDSGMVRRLVPGVGR